eukprot:9503195-Pyramimonas_sp.AAC.2
MATTIVAVAVVPAGRRSRVVGRRSWAAVAVAADDHRPATAVRRGDGGPNAQVESNTVPRMISPAWPP